ncbi:MAG: DinB family protein [Opitutaceae bacterium]|nr:DinB family protein [Opitutaceae bacterium]
MLSALPVVAIDAHLAVLRQGVRLLATLGDGRYAARHPLCFNASIGGHVRHVIDHYRSFLSGLEEGEIDYEKRDRDPLVESRADYASGLIEAIAGRLIELAPGLDNRGLQLCAETATGMATATTALRELEFLLSHTIHHYALVAVMARLQGCEPEPDFGVAPSTLRFQQQQAAPCAR